MVKYLSWVNFFSSWYIQFILLFSLIYFLRCRGEFEFYYYYSIDEFVFICFFDEDKF